MHEKHKKRNMGENIEIMLKNRREKLEKQQWPKGRILVFLFKRVTNSSWNEERKV